MPRLGRTARTSLALAACAVALAPFTSPASAAPPAADVVEPPVALAGPGPRAPRELGPGERLEVVVAVRVGRDGVVLSAEPVDTSPHVGRVGVEPLASFARAAVEAARAQRFRPASRAGRPVPSRVHLSVVFEGPREPETLARPEARGPASALAPPRSTLLATPAPATPATPSATPATPATPASPTSPTSPTRGPAAPGSGDEAPAAPAEPLHVDVVGRHTPPSRGASDFNLRIGALASVPRGNAAELLKLAPGILLTNEGGDGHASQIFLRGFDARLGQDLELTVGGVPINEVGNPKGNGYSDLGFIIPEVVERLRVLEGPFDPHQGNFAVAGGADYDLGLERRGLSVKYQGGSFDTHRLLGTFGPKGASPHTFGAVELYTTAGFGRNRDGQRASAIAQYEGQLGKNGSVRVGGSAYLARFHSAGVLRDDDVARGRVGFYDTYDPRQSSEGLRFSAHAELSQKTRDLSFSQLLYVTGRDLRVRENFTGSLLDPQEPQQTPHQQRGDLLDQWFGAVTFGGKGSARYTTKLLGQRQELELGYSARGDATSAVVTRNETANDAPYRRELDQGAMLGNVGAFVDASLRPTSFITLRGGLRADLFTFDVHDRCAVGSVRQPSDTRPPGDESCLSQQDFGRYREPDQRASTSSLALLPRATLLVGPFQKLTLSLSYGEGVRSIDPVYVTQDLKTPFAHLRSAEGGVGYAGGVGDVELVARSIFFHTWVEKDLIFSESAGRAVLGGPSLRTGWAGALRATGTFFDLASNLTLVKARFEQDGLLIPYVPGAVLRVDGSLFHRLPLVTPLGKPIKGTLATGITYVAPRPLPFGQRSGDIFTLDVSATLAWGPLELGLIATNLLDTQYRLGEYNYASSFGSEPQPTLVPMRHFAAGPPRALFLTLQGTLGGES